MKTNKTFFHNRRLVKDKKAFLFRGFFLSFTRFNYYKNRIVENSFPSKNLPTQYTLMAQLPFIYKFYIHYLVFYISTYSEEFLKRTSRVLQTGCPLGSIQPSINSDTYTVYKFWYFSTGLDTTGPNIILFHVLQYETKRAAGRPLIFNWSMFMKQFCISPGMRKPRIARKVRCLQTIVVNWISFMQIDTYMKTVCKCDLTCLASRAGILVSGVSARLPLTWSRPWAWSARSGGCWGSSCRG